MKKTKTLLLIALGLLWQLAVFSQEKHTMPKWVSDKGWWMVESNIHTPRQCIVYFYNNLGELVYKENVTGMKLRVNSTAVKMRLKQALEASVTAWEQQHTVKENEGLVINQFKKRLHS